MKMYIKSYNKAQDFLDNCEYDSAISIIAPDNEEMKQRKNHLIVRFDDIEQDYYQDYVGPSKNQIEAILSWDKLKNDGIILVHCTAGKSRSVAVGIGILCKFGLSPKDALLRVIRIREEEGNPLIVPNRLIIKYIDEILDLNNELIDVIDEFYKTLSDSVPLVLLRLGRHTIED